MEAKRAALAALLVAMAVTFGLAGEPSPARAEVINSAKAACLESVHRYPSGDAMERSGHTGSRALANRVPALDP